MRKIILAKHYGKRSAHDDLTVGRVRRIAHSSDPNTTQHRVDVCHGADRPNAFETVRGRLLTATAPLGIQQGCFVRRRQLERKMLKGRRAKFRSSWPGQLRQLCQIGRLWQRVPCGNRLNQPAASAAKTVQMMRVGNGERKQQRASPTRVIIDGKRGAGGEAYAKGSLIESKNNLRGFNPGISLWVGGV